MKILLIRNADMSGFGGAEELILNTASELSKKGYDITVATAMPKLTEKARKNGVSIISSPWSKIQSWHGIKQLLIPLYLLWIARLVFWYLTTIRNIKPDILHPQNRDDWIAASLAGKLMNIPVVWSDHADLKHEVVNISSPLKNWQGKLVVWATRFPKKITVDSKAEILDINKWMHGDLDEKLMVAYNGVFDYRPKPVKKPEGKFIYGATSRLLAQKGLFELVEAYNRISKVGNNTELWLIGDGADRARLEKLSKKNKSIKFIGYVDNPLDYAVNFDVYLQPTYTEGFSLSLLEATMLGLPIITTSVGGNTEIIENGVNGLLIDPKNTEQLFKAMKRMLEDEKLRTRLSRSARKTYLEGFEFGKLVETIYIPLYNSVK